jgi:uncharacterized protein YbjT (DUF2867 family)
MADTNSIRVILTGATGMVGEGVLHECLHDERISKILVIGRRSCGYLHPKLSEIVHPDLGNLSSLGDQLKGYDACFFCAGISSVGISANEFVAITYTLTMNFARSLASYNPGIIFCYISGAGTDSTEKGRIRWARVKGKTENDLMQLPFKSVYNFRPGYLQPTRGLRYVNKYYKVIDWAYPLLRVVFPRYVSSLGQLGRAMIQVGTHGYKEQVLEVKDIILAAGSS